MRSTGLGDRRSIANIGGRDGGLFCAVWCWTDGIQSSQLATSIGLSHRSITFRSAVFLLQLKCALCHVVLPDIWESGY